ncbi:hypothetical protein C8R42DRAFT_779496 [Lentinula raphanica]|nr:hypothetical protein C8R42DRAFT_779496 [Lentinula raphanica]
MRAVVYEKPFSVSVLEVPKPSILHPDDVIVKGRPCHSTYLTTTNQQRRCLAQDVRTRLRALSLAVVFTRTPSPLPVAPSVDLYASPTKLKPRRRRSKLLVHQDNSVVGSQEAGEDNGKAADLNQTDALNEMRLENVTNSPGNRPLQPGNIAVSGAEN